MSIVGDLISESYKTVAATITVTPKDDDRKENHVAWTVEFGMEERNDNRVAWTVEFEKIRHDIEHPTWIVDTLLRHFRETDDRLYRRTVVLSRKIESIDKESPADECFNAFIKAFKDDAKVEIEAEDREKRTTTMSLRSSHVLMQKYKTLKVTTTVTAKEDGDGSLVKWTVDSEKKDINIDPDVSLDTAVFIHEMIGIKLQKMNIF